MPTDALAVYASNNPSISILFYTFSKNPISFFFLLPVATTRPCRAGFLRSHVRSYLFRQRWPETIQQVNRLKHSGQTASVHTMMHHHIRRCFPELCAFPLPSMPHVFNLLVPQSLAHLLKLLTLLKLNKSVPRTHESKMNPITRTMADSNITPLRCVSACS